MPRERKKRETAGEFLARLKSDPEWVRRDHERQAAHDAAVTKLAAEVKSEQDPLLEAIESEGWTLSSVWDLVNTRAAYPELVPILAAYLPRLRHPVLREGVARALTVREARGPAAMVLLKELVESEPGKVRWALANALATAGDPSMIEVLEAMGENPKYSDIFDDLYLVIKKLERRLPKNEKRRG